MTTDQRLSEISKQLEVLPAMAAEIEALKKQNTEILTQLAKAPVTPPTPMPPTVQSIWDGLNVDDPLASYAQTDAGWINPGWRSQEFPGDRLMLLACWMGVEPPTGRVLHGGSPVDMGFARREALRFHSLDVAGKYDGTGPANANISPEVAACLLTLRMVDVEQGGLGSNASRSWAAWSNLTDLESLYNQLRDLSSGTGTPSGGQ